jgi:hypothetical protein
MKTDNYRWPFGHSLLLALGVSVLGWGIFIDACMALVQFIRDF